MEIANLRLPEMYDEGVVRALEGRRIVRALPDWGGLSLVLDDRSVVRISYRVTEDSDNIQYEGGPLSDAQLAEAIRA